MPLPKELTDFPTCARKFFKVKKPETGVLVPMKLKPIQVKMNNLTDCLLSRGMPAMVQCLKARRLGASSYIAAKFSHRVYTRTGHRGVVTAHRGDDVEGIFGLYERIYNNLPPEIRPQRKGAHGKKLVLPGLDCEIQVGSAMAANLGRGGDTQLIHASEIQSYGDPETFLSALMACLPVTGDGMLFLEGTGNGPGTWWADLWERSVKGISGFTPIFFPFFDDPENRLTPALADDELTDDEKELKNLYLLDNPQLTWLRHQLVVRCFGNQKLRQREFPCSPEEALTSVGESLWDQEEITACYHRTDPIFRGHITAQGMRKDREGPLILWEKPIDGALYVIGSDTSDGLETSCLGSAEIFRVGKRAGEWPVQVGEWAGHLESMPFAEMLNILGLYFNKALLTVELNYSGRAIQSALARIYFYPNLYRWVPFDKMQTTATTLGWLTTFQSKDVLLAVGDWVIRCNKVILRSPYLVEGLIHYQFDPTKKEYVAIKGSDRMMGFLIAITSWFQHRFPQIPLKELRESLAKMYGGAAPIETRRILEDKAPEPPPDPLEPHKRKEPEEIDMFARRWKPKERYERDREW